MDAVQRALSLILTQDQIDNGGLSIYTTLDPVGAKRRAGRTGDATHQDRTPIQFSSSD